ncbi:MAG: hypothetical protein WB538_12695 [Candidatus Sulfotelmatobacter sp.]
MIGRILGAIAAEGWMNVVYRPLGLVAFSLWLAYLSWNGAKRAKWTAGLFGAMALLSLAGGLVLGYREIISNSSPPASQHIGIIQQQSGSQSGNVAGVQGSVTINSGSTAAQSDAQALGEFRAHHAEIVSDLRNDPKLVNDENYLSRHSELRSFLTDHPALADSVRKSPREFLE